MSKKNRQRRGSRRVAGGRVTSPLRAVRDDERAPTRPYDPTSEVPGYGRPLAWGELSTDELLDIVIRAHVMKQTRGLYEIMGALFAREQGSRYDPIDDEHILEPPVRGWGPTPTDTMIGRIEQLLGGAWLGGWQPADLLRHATRELDKGDDQLVAACIVDDARRALAGTAVHPRWAAQIDDIAATIGVGVPGVSGASTVTAAEQWRVGRARNGDTPLDATISVALLLMGLPRIEVLIPPPGADPNIVDPALRRLRTEAVTPEGIDRKLLVRVRALLAKAESTTFPEEADSLTVKAQELMTRHSIDHAMLHGHESEHVPSARRIPVDDPYLMAKFELLSQIGHANRCRAVGYKQLGFATVIGFDIDLDIVELLFTSLLVQATAAMLAAGTQVDLDGRSTTRSFRQSFLVSFALRIGERLQAAAAATVQQAGEEIGSALVPVLAEQEEAIETARDAVFPHLRKVRSRATHAGGWDAGRAAADQADLGPRDPARKEVRR